MVIPLSVHGEYRELSPKPLKYSCALKVKGHTIPCHDREQPSGGIDLEIPQTHCSEPGVSQTPTQAVGKNLKEAE